MPLTDPPIGDEEFATALDALGVEARRPLLAVGVSGGADSTALAFLASRFAAQRGGRVVAYIVDHRMRPASAEEAGIVAERLARLGIDHRILVWSQGRPGVGHARARDARLALLMEAAVADGITDLLLAQHADDQVETVLMRLAKGSGVDGLAGIPAVRIAGLVRILRPLLGFPKGRLVATSKAHGLDWIEDPSNLDLRYERGRIRRRLGALTEQGSKVREGLLAVAGAAAELRARLDAILGDVDGVRLLPHGYAEVALSTLDELPAPIARRLLARLIHDVGGARRPPGDAATDRLLARIREPSLGGPATLGRVRVLRGDTEVRLVREARNLPAPVEIGSTVRLVWDNRLKVTVAAPGRTARLRPVGRSEAAELSRHAGIPFEAALTLPCLETCGGEILWPDVSTRNDGPKSARVQALMVEWMPASAGGRTSSLFGRFGALSSILPRNRGAGRYPDEVRAPL